ncbi:MAG TPA: hypothetical protein VET85_02685 [Stellaceae bacterium]|nr:hypothetical protein [Stellaceae bacterium]
MDRRDLLKSAAVVATGAVAVAQRDAASATEGGEAAKPAPNVNELVVSYIAAWNERTAERRRELVAKTWTEDGAYIDAHRHGVGHAAIDLMIQTAQEHFPGYRLRLMSGIETHNRAMRFSWSAGGAPEAPLYLAGTDFAVIAEDGRLKSVTGFVDAAPAPVARS